VLFWVECLYFVLLALALPTMPFGPFSAWEPGATAQQQQEGFHLSNAAADLLVMVMAGMLVKRDWHTS
jgi:hypothetical protein